MEVANKKSLSELTPQEVSQLDPTRLAELSRQEFERQHKIPSSKLEQNVSGYTKEQYELHLREQAEKEKKPMTGAEYRQQQALGVKPEMVKAPPTYEEFLAANFPHLLQEEEEAKQKKTVRQQPDVPLTEEDILRLEALKELDRSQMPAVADKDVDGLLVKTIEHYTFADGEDNASFYVSFDKDLFPGAAAFVQETQVKIESRATSLEIRLQEVPVSEKTPTVLAEWRLTLSPLFGRVEPSMTTHKVKNGKLSIKLCKAKVGPWKKGVKYS
jgi:hypothetical protein